MRFRSGGPPAGTGGAIASKGLSRGLLGLLGLMALMGVPISGCGDDCPSLSTCDIRKAGCQRRVMCNVASLRERDAQGLPEVLVVDEAQLLEMVEEDSEAYREENQDEDDDRSQEEREADQDASFLRWNRGLALLGLSEASYSADDATDDWITSVAAAYLPLRQTIVIVDRGDPMDDERSIEVLAHESVHAMQDAELDLVEFQEDWGGNFDANLGIDGVIEGEAVLYQLLASVQLAGVTPDDVDWRALFNDWRSEMLTEAEDDTAPLSRAGVRFPYAFGGGYVTQHWLARGRDGVDALFEEPPLSTGEIMFGPDGLGEGDVEAVRDEGLPELGGNYEPDGWASVGAWIARIYAARAGVPVSERLEAARAHSADLLSMHWDEEQDEVAVAWRVRARDEDARDQWLGDGSPPSGRVPFSDWQPLGTRDAVVLAAESDLMLPSGEALAWSAVPDDEDDDDGAGDDGDDGGGDGDDDGDGTASASRRDAIATGRPHRTHFGCLQRAAQP